nr:hypothetical protein [Verrucomicrobiota bacterium]
RPAWPDPTQDPNLAKPGDRSQRHPKGYPTLRIENGRLDLTTLNTAPFGPAPNLDLSDLAEVDLSDTDNFVATGLPNT